MKAVNPKDFATKPGEWFYAMYEGKLQLVSKAMWKKYIKNYRAF